MQKHLATIAVIAVFLGSFYLYNAWRHPVYQHPARPIGPNEKARKFLKARFLPVDTADFPAGLEKRFGELAATNSTNWEHSDELLAQIERFIRCYSTATNFESYLDFRTAGVPYEFSFDSDYLIMGSAASNHGIVFPTNGLQRALSLWVLSRPDSTDGFCARITDVSLDRMTIHVFHLHSGVSPLFGVAYRESGAPVSRYPTLVATAETPESIKKRGGAVCFAVVGLPCEVNEDHDFTKAHYLHLCFFWTDKYQTWIPLELDDDAPLKVPVKPPMGFPDALSFPVFF